MTFEDLDFQPHRNHGSGVQARHTFANGYMVSVIQTPYSYGGEAGKYELAILTANGDLVYDTPITDDVLGWQSEEQITQLLADVEALPARVTA